LWAKYQEVLHASSQASASLERAKQIEREYLFKACNGKSGIQGLDNAIYTKICNWRDHFKEPYATASAKFQQRLNDLRQQAATAQKNNIAREQIAQQQEVLQMLQIQQASRQPVTQSGPSFQAQPFVNPFAEKNPSVVCNHIGNQTICK